jgi:hypothetical protein
MAPPSVGLVTFPALGNSLEDVMYKLILAVAVILLVGCDCTRLPDPDTTYKVTWQSGSCTGHFIYLVGRYNHEIGVKCDDGRTVYNLTNFEVE